MSQQINLYNPAFIPPREYVTAMSLAVATGLSLLAVLAGATWFGREAAYQEAQLAHAQAQQKEALAAMESARAALAARVANPVLTAKLEELQARQKFREAVLASSQQIIRADGQGFSPYLRGLAKQVVPGLWLTEIALDADGSKLILAGRTLRQDLVPEYVRRLNAEKAFAGKSFAGLDVGAVDVATEAAGRSARPPVMGATTGSVTEWIPGPVATGTAAPVTVAMESGVPPALSFRLFAVPGQSVEVKN